MKAFRISAVGGTNKVIKFNEMRPKRETEYVPKYKHISRRARGRIVEVPKMEFSKYSSLDPSK